MQIQFLVFAFVIRFFNQPSKLKKNKTFTIKVLSRYDHGQLNIKLSKKEYRILASQDNYIFVMNKCSKFSTNMIVIPHMLTFFHINCPKNALERMGEGDPLRQTH